MSKIFSTKYHNLHSVHFSHMLRKALNWMHVGHWRLSISVKSKHVPRFQTLGLVWCWVFFLRLGLGLLLLLLWEVKLPGPLLSKFLARIFDGENSRRRGNTLCHLLRSTCIQLNATSKCIILWSGHEWTILHFTVVCLVA